MSQLKQREAEFTLSLPFCSTRLLDVLNDAHPQWKGYFFNSFY